MDGILKGDHSDQSYRAICSVVLFISLYKVVLPFQSVNEILMACHSNESYLAALYVVFF